METFYATQQVKVLTRRRADYPVRGELPSHATLRSVHGFFLHYRQIALYAKMATLWPTSCRLRYDAK